MIPPLRFAILLFAIAVSLPGASAIAQTLYKWIEEDGSITFSADPPEHKVDYETVSSMNDGISKKDDLTNAKPTADLTEQPSQSTTQSKSTTDNLPTTQSPRTAPIGQLPPGITAAQNEEEKQRPAPAVGAAVATQASPDANATSRKQRQCEDLRKRVVSLERRLKTHLTPEDMDNTVVHMARYQRSHDQYCVQ